MSGHSKWSKVKHQKATTDVAKAQAFTKASRAITVSVREGGGITDPNLNFRLRLAIEKARDVNMPKNTIERAIEKGSGVDAVNLMQIAYECFGPQGVALLVETTTDNKMRTISEVKNVLERGGGRLASPGSVAYLFKRWGILVIPKANVTYDTLLTDAIVAGAHDVIEREDMFEVYTKPHDMHTISQKLASMNLLIDNTEFIMHPVTPVSVDDKVKHLIDALVTRLQELDDVDHVYTNVE